MSRFRLTEKARVSTGALGLATLCLWMTACSPAQNDNPTGSGTGGTGTGGAGPSSGGSPSVGESWRDERQRTGSDGRFHVWELRWRLRKYRRDQWRERTPAGSSGGGGLQNGSFWGHGRQWGQHWRLRRYRWRRRLVTPVPLDPALMSHCTGSKPIKCTFPVPADGNFNVTVELGSAQAASTSQVEAQLGRIVIPALKLAAGAYSQQTFSVSVHNETHDDYTAPDKQLAVLIMVTPRRFTASATPPRIYRRCSPSGIPRCAIGLPIPMHSAAGLRSSRSI